MTDSSRVEGPSSAASGASGEGVLVEQHAPGVAVLVLNRVSARNAISTEQAKAIASACSSLAADVSVRAIVLASADTRAFCVGADLKERNAFTDSDLRDQRPIMRAAFGGVLSLPVPVIAAVESYALGGGFELALSCDLIIAGWEAVFGLPEVSVGLVPGGGGTQLLTRRIGWSRSADLIFSARRIDAAEAYRLGVADRLVPPGSALSEALGLATTIAANSPVGVRTAKRAMRLGLSLALDDGLEIEDRAWQETAFSPDRREGIAAFNEKRPPVF